MLKKGFFRKFTYPEFNFILGKRWSNVTVLIVILSFSMLAIGLGQGAIKYLDLKMNNPFVSFVNVKIPFGSNWNLDKLEKAHNKLHPNKSFSEYYGFQKPYPVYYGGANFTNLTTKKTEYAKVKKGTKSDPIYDFIKSNPENKDIVKNECFEWNGWGCVVSLDYLKNDKTRLNYDNIENITYLQYRKSIDDKDTYINIPIQGFVKTFPYGIDMIVGEKLFHAMDNFDFWVDIAHPDSAVAINGYMQFYVIDNPKLEKYLKKQGFKETQDHEPVIDSKGKMYLLRGVSALEKEDNFKYAKALQQL